MRALLLSFGFLITACGGQVAGPIDGGAVNDASTTDVFVANDATPPPPPPPGDATVGCNDVSPLASQVTPKLLAQDAPPVATSSPPPAPGTYALESVTIYTGTGGSTASGTSSAVTLRIEANGTLWKSVTQTANGVDRRNFALTKQALGLALAATCNGTDTSPVTFIPISSPGFVMQVKTQQLNQVGVYLFRPFLK